MASASAPSARLVPNPTTPEYRNWLSLGHALTTVLCEGLRPFIKRETEAFYNSVKAAIAATLAGPCTCVHVPGRRPSEFHDMKICTWANTIQLHHRRRRPNWKQSDSSKWLDPILGPWEIAMLFLPDLGGHAHIQGAEDMDITAILNLMYWCDHFTVQQPLIKDVRDARNDKWVHVPKLELSDVDKKDAFDAIEKLLQDPELIGDLDAQKALGEIVNLRKVSNLQSMEAQVLNHLKCVIDKEILDINDKLTSVLEDSVRYEEQRTELMARLDDLEEALDNRNNHENKAVMNSVLHSLGCLLTYGAENIKGCTMQKYGDPLQLKYFDFEDLINSSRVDFIGRQWLYNEVENIFEDQNKRGVLITGNPGSGKSAFLFHLICTKQSSPFIHNRILGYHFCMHSDKGTQNGAKFVRNLANMIARRLTKYREIIERDSFVHRVLHYDCSQDPEWCFEQGILIPLKKLSSRKPRETWFLVIDALDECSTDKAEVLSMLKSKMRQFPLWLKLIMTSRNVSSITSSLDGVQIVELRSDDERNLEDIDTYLSLKVFSLKASIFQKIKTVFSITDNISPTQKIVARLAEKAQGNFLFIKVALESWMLSTDSVSWETFPKSLDSTFQLYFERKYGSQESFQSLRQILEILVATYTPISANEIYLMLKFDRPSLDFEYDLIPKLDEVSLFLWHGLENGLVRIYHSSLSEWLTSDANKGKFYYVKKRNGHKRLANFYLQAAQNCEKPLMPEQVFYLASHIVGGGSGEAQFLSVPSTCVNSSDPETKTTALHMISSTTHSNVTKLLTKHFSNVDCLDSSGRTPVFQAAINGNLDNLIVLFQRGANLNHTVKYAGIESASDSIDSVVECKRKLCEYSLLHASAQEGQVRVVDFLIGHHADIFKPTGVNNTALQLAAANGHYKTVKKLRIAGAAVDGISLHHAALGGHNQVVQYLLDEGVKDNCINATLSTVVSDNTDSGFKNARIHVYDNHFIYLGETALHAAVGKEHLSVIESLLRVTKNATNCPNAAGRRPLHDAVYHNKYNALKVMLAAGLDTSVRCKTGSTWTKKQQLNLQGFAQNQCPCGFSPLHTAAIHGNHSVAELLIRYGSDVNAGDCNGSTPLHVASCQGMVSLISLLVDNGANISAKNFNGFTPLHSAAVCRTPAVFHPLLKMGSDFFATDNKQMTALHHIINDLDVVGKEFFADLYVNKPKDWIEVTTKKEEALHELRVQYPWLNALIEFIKSVSSTEAARMKEQLKIDSNRFRAMINTYGSVFQTLGLRSNASFLLTGAKIFGESRLVLTTTPFIFAHDLTLCEILQNFVITMNRPYEPTLIPVYFKRAISKPFAQLFTPGILNCSKVNSFVALNMVYSVDVALQAGADVNCKDNHGLTPLRQYLHTGGRHMSKVLVKHNVNVHISCGDPFEMSSLHLVSYHKLHYLHYFYQFLSGDENWQKYLGTDNAIFDYFLDKFEEVNGGGRRETKRSGDGPLALAIKSHPDGIKVIDDCCDADGYNALHRAAQGANLIAIEKFLSWGANPWLETSQGLSPLLISIIHAVKYRPFLNLDQRNVLTALEVEMASMSASVILSRLLLNGTFHVGCDPTRSDLTIYHLAASRGMWQFIAHLFSNTRVTGLDVNCPNRDRITPMYLAKFIGGEECKWHSPWCKVVDVIKERGGVLQYPSLEAEYFLIFNVYFGLSPRRLLLELTDHEILTLQKDCGRDECNDYRTGPEADLSRKSEHLDEIYSDYDKKVDDCATCGQNCLPEIDHALSHLMSVMCTFKLQQSFKIEHSKLRNEFVTFLDEENERVRSLLLAATKPHLAMSCADGMSRTQTIDSENPDMCSGERIDLELGLRNFYRTFKDSFDRLGKISEEVKSVMFCKGYMPYVLGKIRKALYSYDNTLHCDWQAITIKYVQLSFQVRTLNFWRLAVLETSTVPSLSDFLSFRMDKVFMDPSKEAVELILKLASDKTSVTFNYLTILRFVKPPLREGTLG